MSTEPTPRLDELALRGGTPVRPKLLPYGRQNIDEEDIAAVADVLRGDWLTTGPNVEQFEQSLARFCGARHAVAVCNGTAALHAAMFALRIGPGDEVIVPPMTFAATANCIVYQGGTPVFSDVEAETLLLDPDDVERKITSRTKAVIAVDYAGQPCDYDRLAAICKSRNLPLVDDACHAIGGSYRGRPVGSLADMSTFSFHPVKNMTTGEGGAITTDDAELADRLRLFRNHGINSDFRQRQEQGGFFYEMVELGYNYRITDIQCALGMSQLRKLAAWVERRQQIAGRYNAAFASLPGVAPLKVRRDVVHGYHLYMVRLQPERLTMDRLTVFKALRAENIGVNVHYIPVHFHPFYRYRFAFRPGLCPVAEAAYEQLITLPIFPTMRDSDVDDVVQAVSKVLGAYAR
jgi:perosamine synthetase